MFSEEKRWLGKIKPTALHKLKEECINIHAQRNRNWETIKNGESDENMKKEKWNADAESKSDIMGKLDSAFGSFGIRAYQGIP